MQTESAYLKRGASSDKREVHAAIKNTDGGLFPGAFCKINEDIAGDKAFCNVVHADGAGTKSSLAYIYYKETGSADVFRGIAQDSTVMNIDDIVCVGGTDNFILSNTIGRNAARVGGDAIAAVISGYTDFTDKIKEYGINITLAGGETADVGDLVSTIICDSTCVARIPKASVVDCSNIAPGDVIIGLASFGQAVYEDKYNSGIGSNGLTAARHMLLSHKYAEKYPETYSATTEKRYVYSGRHKINDSLEGTTITVGEAILSPTRTYAPVIKALLDKKLPGIHGIIHCSGGGQTKCKNFGKNIHYIKDSLFERPPIFSLIANSGEISGKEIYSVFNMGHRMEIYCSYECAGEAIRTAEKFGIEAKIVGRVEKANGENKVTLIDRDSTYIY